jgi:hypothetical protein
MAERFGRKDYSDRSARRHGNEFRGWAGGPYLAQDMILRQEAADGAVLVAANDRGAVAFRARRRIVVRRNIATGRVPMLPAA